MSFHSFFKKRFHLFIFREKGRQGEREGEKHQCVVASRMPTAGNLASSPGMYPDRNHTRDPLVHRLALNPLSHTNKDHFLIHFCTNMVAWLRKGDPGLQSFRIMVRVTLQEKPPRPETC